MSGLQNIILHHSYFTGLRVAIPCAGHTYLVGTNGAGKTSALLLIPMFYGKEPASLVVQAADKGNFVSYYLPNAQSMIVFEYQRLTGETCCAVIYRHRQNQYAYRFVKGNYLAGSRLYSPTCYFLWHSIDIRQLSHQIT
ncbi:ATP-binding protein [Vreelandella rituensis]|nr:ATP-binding protein [Halomonas rituensis]